MIGIGERLKDRDGRFWDVVAQDGGRWIIRPTDGAGSPERVSGSYLADEFKVDGPTTPAPAAVDERSALAKFGARLVSAAERNGDGWGRLHATHVEDRRTRAARVAEDAEEVAAEAAARSHFDSGA